jgi:hypothetical protein
VVVVVVAVVVVRVVVDKVGVEEAVLLVVVVVVVRAVVDKVVVVEAAHLVVVAADKEAEEAVVVPLVVVAEAAGIANPSRSDGASHGCGAPFFF